MYFSVSEMHDQRQGSLHGQCYVDLVSNGQNDQENHSSQFRKPIRGLNTFTITELQTDCSRPFLVSEIRNQSSDCCMINNTLIVF